MGRACCYIMYQTNKKGNISIDVSVSLCYNYSDQTIKTKQQTKQGSIIKVFPPLCLKGFKNMITQDITLTEILLLRGKLNNNRLKHKQIENTFNLHSI